MAKTLEVAFLLLWYYRCTNIFWRQIKFTIMKIYIALHMPKCFSVSGKHLENSHPSNSPIVNSPGKLLPRKIPPGIFCPMFLNIPSGFFYFLFHYCHCYHWYYLKNYFIILCSKSQAYGGVFLKKCSLSTKIVAYSEKFCWSSMLIDHYYIHLFVLKVFILKADECDVTQFNQLGLNSSFSHRAIN